jgi:hypothetical protein
MFETTVTTTTPLAEVTYLLLLQAESEVRTQLSLAIQNHQIATYIQDTVELSPAARAALL